MGDGGVGRSLVVFALGGAAQGVPIVVVLVAIERSGGPAWLTIAAVARLAPYLMCSPFAGAIAGRFEPRAVFAASGLARGVFAVAIGMAIATDASPAVLAVLLFGVVAAGTPAYPALMRVVCDGATRSLDRTSTFVAGLESLVFWGGPALGGLLLATGTAGALAVGAAVAAASVVLAPLVPVVGSGRTSPPGPTTRTIRDATRFLGAPALRPAIASVLAVNVLGGFVAVLLVRLPPELQLGGDREYGLMTFAQGAGGLVAFVALLGAVRPGRRPLMPLAAAGSAVALVATARGEVRVALVACAALGAAVMASEIGATIAVCRRLPRALVAPAFGTFDAAMVVAMIAGAVAATGVVGAIGIRPGFLLVGVVTPFATVGLIPRGASSHTPRIPHIPVQVPDPGLTDIGNVAEETR